MSQSEKSRKKPLYQYTETKEIVENLNRAIEFNENALKSTGKAQTNIGNAVEVIKEKTSKLYCLKEFYENQYACLSDNDVARDSIAVMASLSDSEKRSTEHLAIVAGVVEKSAHTLMGTVSTSNAVVGNMGSSTYYIYQQVINPESIGHTIDKINEPTAKQRKELLLPKLKVIKPELADKLEGAWQTLYDSSKVDRFRQAATSIRELMSDVLQILAPDKKVKAMPWFKPETDKENQAKINVQSLQYLVQILRLAIKT
jgi:hypothetical protein